MTSRVRKVLQHLADTERWATAPELNAVTGSPRGGISSQLVDLLKRGLVIKRPDPFSYCGRNEWAITPKGRAYLRADPKTTRSPRRMERPDGYGGDGGIALERYWPG